MTALTGVTDRVLTRLLMMEVMPLSTWLKVLPLKRNSMRLKNLRNLLVVVYLKMNTGFTRPLINISNKIKITSANSLRTWKVFPKKLPLELLGFTNLKRRTNCCAPASMLTTLLPNPNLITSMDANTQLLTESIELLMLWFQGRRLWFAVSVMSVRDAPKRSKEVELEFM